MFGALYAEANGFDRVIHLESDAYLISQRARGLRDGLSRWLGGAVVGALRYAGNGHIGGGRGRACANSRNLPASPTRRWRAGSMKG